jgi:hypothetical protein
MAVGRQHVQGIHLEGIRKARQLRVEAGDLGGGGGAAAGAQAMQTVAPQVVVPDALKGATVSSGKDLSSSLRKT